MSKLINEIGDWYSVPENVRQMLRFRPSSTRFMALIASCYFGKHTSVGKYENMGSVKSRLSKLALKCEVDTQRMGRAYYKSPCTAFEDLQRYGEFNNVYEWCLSVYDNASFWRDVLMYAYRDVVDIMVGELSVEGKKGNEIAELTGQSLRSVASKRKEYLSFYLAQKALNV